VEEVLAYCVSLRQVTYVKVSSNQICKSSRPGGAADSTQTLNIHR
jgi:hypothetical protein